MAIARKSAQFSAQLFNAVVETLLPQFRQQLGGLMPWRVATTILHIRVLSREKTVQSKKIAGYATTCILSAKFRN
jgi:hypothetical protein